MNRFISCFAITLILTISNFASAEQTSNFELSSKHVQVLPSNIDKINTNETKSLTDGYSINVINQSNRFACIAVVEANPLQSVGWFEIANGNSQSFSGISSIHAEVCGSQGSIYWAPAWIPVNNCLFYGVNFSNVFTPENAVMCSSLGGVMRTFYTLPSAMNWTLNW